MTVLSEGDNVDGEVVRVIHNKTGVPVGLLVNIGVVNAFAPRSLIPSDKRNHIDALVGMWTKGVVLKVDEKRCNVVIDPQSIGEYTPPPAIPKSDEEISIADEHLQVLLDNLRQIVPSDDGNRYLGRQNAKNILVALAGVDYGDDPDKWYRMIQSRRPK